MTKTAKIIITIIVLVIAGLVIWSVMSGEPVKNDLHTSTPDQGEITVTGKMVCLPHRDTSGPQTMECAFGLLGDDGNYYALYDGSGNSVGQLSMEVKIFVHGIFEPKEDTRYASVGVINVDKVTVPK